MNRSNPDEPVLGRGVAKAVASDHEPRRLSIAGEQRHCRMSLADHLNNALASALARLGLGPFHVLMTRGRRSGRRHSNPVVLVEADTEKWLVAPYGAVSWVLNARTSGRVHLRRGRYSGDYEIHELTPEQAGSILKRYVQVASATRPYFRSTVDSPVEAFVSEAAQHPVFALTRSA